MFYVYTEYSCKVALTYERELINMDSLLICPSVRKFLSSASKTEGSSVDGYLVGWLGAMTMPKA